MILGLSDTEKKFKTAMDTAGADMTVVNSWLKLYVKTKKNSSGVAKRYYCLLYTSPSPRDCS